MKDYVLKIDDEELKGTLTIKVPSHIERLRFAQSSGIDGSDDLPLDKVISLMEKVEDYVKDVNFKLGKEKIDTLEELGHYKVGFDVIQKAIAIVSGGIPTEGKP